MLGLGLIVIAIVVIIALIVVLLFNGLISKRNRVQDAAAQIDVQLKRRYDLIPNLVDTVKGYMKYEKSVLTTVTSLRSSIVTGSMQDKAQADNKISQALKTIFAVAENYPDLKASANFQDLQNQLVETENKIAFVRTSYNDYVLDYNNALQTFPGNMVAGPFKFQPSTFFKTDTPAESQPVKVSFEDVNNPQQPAAQHGQPKAKGASKQKPHDGSA
jgi:LemA protein